MAENATNRTSSKSTLPSEPEIKLYRAQLLAAGELPAGAADDELPGLYAAYARRRAADEAQAEDRRRAKQAADLDRARVLSLHKRARSLKIDPEGKEEETILRLIQERQEDEARRQEATAAENSTLINLLDHRYDDDTVTILIANQDKKQFAEAMGDTIVSRIQEKGEAFVCDWPSYRHPGKWRHPTSWCGQSRRIAARSGSRARGSRSRDLTQRARARIASQRGSPVAVR
jgi:hypothetical protein